MDKKNIIQLVMIITCAAIANITLTQTFWITSSADSGPGSVRQAITDLNNSLDAPNSIRVSLAGNVNVILESNLPAIEKPVTFDGQDVLSPYQLTLNGNGVVDIGLELATNLGTDDYEILNITITNIKGNSAIGILTKATSLTINNCIVTNVIAENLIGSGTESGTENGSELPVAIGIDTKFISAGSTNFITNSTIDTITNKNVNGSAYGISIDTRIGTVDNCTIKNVTCGENKALEQNKVIAAGILDASDPNVSSISLLVQHNTISNINSVESTSGSDTAETFSTAYGIKSLFSISQCLSNTISNIASDNADTSLAEGISMEAVTESITCEENIISHITSGNGTTTSSAHGIALSQILADGTCNTNVISNLTSGTGEESQVHGIILKEIDPKIRPFSCNDNQILTINNILTSNATAAGITARNGSGSLELIGNTISSIYSRKEVEGISIDNTPKTNLENNTISTITAEKAHGIALYPVTNLNVNQNTIEYITATLESAHGILLGSEENGSLEGNDNNSITNNSISHITGPQGYGITILNKNSTGNALLTNLICDITTKAIEIEAQTDAVCQILHATLLPNDDLQIQGILNNLVSADRPVHLLQFFINNCNTIPQTPVFIGNSFLVPTGIQTPFTITLSPSVPVTSGQYVTMTATDNELREEDPLNTSEVSNSRRVRITSINASTICTLVCDKGSDDGSCCMLYR